MDRTGQLKNVAFGGDWSEAIVPREQIQQALETLRQAADGAELYDPLTPEVRIALEVCRQFARGDLLAAAFEKHARLPNPGLRRMELQRVMGVIASVVGNAQSA